MGALALDRRGFLVSVVAVGGGMALGLRPAVAAGTGFSGPWGPDAAAGNEFSPWLEIGGDGVVSLRIPNPESGNGTMTQMAMNVAEELGCDWDKVRIATASMSRDYAAKNVYTVGFLPTFGGHATDKVRMAYTMQLGASVRERLKAAAAARWGVPAGEVRVADGVLSHAGSGRKLGFGEVAAQAAKVTLAAEPGLKAPAEWTLIGKASPAKLNIPDIASGRATFGIDVVVPGMVHAALRQAPVQGGRLKRVVNGAAVLKMPGVRKLVVLDPANSGKSPVAVQTNFGLGETAVQSAVAVIADHFWQAKTALEALEVEWDLGAGAQVADGGAVYKAMATRREVADAKVLAKVGDVAAANGKRVVEAEYLTPWCDNAVMEPLNGTALVTADSAEVWGPAQDLRQAYWVAVDETGLPPDKVKFHGTFVGSNFGRRTQAEDLRMVVAVARQYPGVPVKLIWTREEMFRQGRYRTPVATRFRAVLDDASGLPAAVEGRTAFAGDHPLFHLSQGFVDPPYFHSGVIPNVLLTQGAVPVHVLNGAYRGPCYNSHAFITETFVDECAHGAGIDPLEYRLKLLAKWDKSWSDCLRVVVEQAGYGQPLPKGEGIGLAISAWPFVMPGRGSVAAVAARVAVSRKGELTVKRLDCAFDCGRVANADAVRSQIEGGAIFGLNMTLNEEMTLKDGAMVEANFDEYPMLRMAETPPVHVHFEALSGGERFEMMGEVPVGPVGPAVGNAIFAATGHRLRSTPFRKHDLSWS